MLSTILIAVAEAAEKEPSKAPFYIVGGALVLWAALISAAGIRRSDFAATNRTGAAIALVTALLVAGTMAASVITA